MLKHNMEIDSHYVSLDNDDLLSKSFSWLNKYVLYLPMYTMKLQHINEVRSQLLGILIISISVISTLFHYIMVIWWIMYDWSDNYVAQIAYIIQETAMTLSRLLSLIYYYRYFNFPWLSNIHQIKLYHYPHILKAVNKSNHIIQLLFVVIILSHIATFIVYGISDYLNAFWLLFITDFCGPIFLFIPIYTSFVVLSVIFIKYYAFLLYLITKINKTDNDFCKILNEYKILIKSFHWDYNVYLRWSIFLWLFQFLLETWTSSYDIFEGNDPLLIKLAELITYITDFAYVFLFVYAASKMSETFEKMEVLLYEAGQTFVDNHIMNYKSWAYNYLLQYITKYSLTIGLGGITLTKKNTFKFVVTFAVARLISYAAEYLYE